MGRYFFGIPAEKRSAVRFLEVGCGSGANLWMIAREGFSAHGLDFSGASLALAAKMLANYKAVGHLLQGDMTSIAHPAASFDAVVDVFSSNCLDNAGHAKFLDEVARILKPGGRFFSYTPSQNSDAWRDHEPATLIDDSTLDGIKRPSSPYAGNDYPFRFTTNEEYARDLRARGLKITGNETVSRTYGGVEVFAFVVIEGVKLPLGRDAGA